jgi:fructose-1,6-bisphosphatase/inositol monophosphatase family enzyme
METVTGFMRQIGQNFCMPLFRREVDQGIVSKPGDKVGPSPVGIADIGTQILVAREISRLFPSEAVFGEEYVPDFSMRQLKIIGEFDIAKVLTTDRPDAQRYLQLVQAIIDSGKTLPKSALDKYLPSKKRGWVIDPVDGTIRFTQGLDFSILFARVNCGRVTDSWCYFPVQDEMLRRLNSGVSEYVTFDKGEEVIKRFAKPEIKPFSEMDIVYLHAHPNVALDAVTLPLFQKEDGQKFSHAEIIRKFGNTFHSVSTTDGYSSAFREMLLGNFQAVAAPGAYPWDHFGPAHVAEGAGYHVGFFNGEDYFGKNGEIPLVREDGKEHVKYTGGVLYAAPEVWNGLNRILMSRAEPSIG